MPSFALLGCSHVHTKNFAKKLADREEARVVSVYDRDPDLAARYAAELDATACDRPETAADAAGVDAVVICSTTAEHERLVELATARGLPLFVEKPLGLGEADAARMARRIEEAGVPFQTGYFQRGDPIHQFARQKIAEGALGRVTRLRLSNAHAGAYWGIFDGTDSAWMARRDEAGCGGFGDLGTHKLDLLLWMMPAPVSVTAAIGAATGKYPGTDEFGEGMLRYADGTVATVAAGWVDKANPVTLLVSGTAGHICVFRNELFYQSDHDEGADGKTAWTDLPAAWPHAFDVFLDAVAGREHPPLVTAREAAERNRILAAMEQGAAQSAWIAV